MDHSLLALLPQESFMWASAGLRRPLRRCHAQIRCSHFRPVYGLWLNGAEVASSSGDTFAVRSPATHEHLADVAAAADADVDKAVKAGHDAYLSGSWSKSDIRLRYKVLNSIAEQLRARVATLAEMESAQTGRAVREMKAQLGRLPDWFEYFGALVRTEEGSVPPFFGPYLNYVRSFPLGVVGQITPFNHPLLIAIKKLAPALAAGNSVVLKPSELAPITVLELGRMAQEAGLPDGVLNIVPGTGPIAGKALASHPLIKKVDFTGGTNTGRAIASLAGQNLAGVVTELGGKAPMLLFPDADVGQAVNTCAFASFVASGQTCVTGARLLVHESLLEEVQRRFVAKAASIRLGDPADLDTQMGPLISQAQLDRVEYYVQVARDEGAKVLTGGRRPPDLPPKLVKGYYYEPTVIGDVTPSMRIAQEEVFGPVVVIYPFKTEEEAIQLANHSPYGLAASVWTKDVARAHRVADALEVGIVWVNDHHRNDPSSPWGGMKDSGMGRENGREAFNEYTQSKSVIVGCSSSPFDWFAQADARYS